MEESVNKWQSPLRKSKHNQQLDKTVNEIKKSGHQKQNNKQVQSEGETVRQKEKKSRRKVKHSGQLVSTSQPKNKVRKWTSPPTNVNKLVEEWKGLWRSEKVRSTSEQIWSENEKTWHI